MKPSVGIIGVGLMGHGIAANIVRKGWPLQFFVHPGNQPTDDLQAAGAAPCTDLQALARGSDILLLCVTGTPQVEAIMEGANGILAALQPDSTVIDCSTAIPQSTQRIAQEVEALGGHFMDAAMTRSVREARQGRLNLLVGARPETLRAMRPLLEAFAENITHAGPPGSGHTLKLLHNFVSIGSAVLLSEAAAAAARAGIPAKLLVSVLKSGGGHGAALDRIGPYITEGDASRLQFSIGNAAKDLSYYHAMATGLGSASRIATGVKQELDDLVQAGHAAQYLSTGASLLSKLQPNADPDFDTE